MRAYMFLLILVCVDSRAGSPYGSAILYEDDVLAEDLIRSEQGNLDGSSSSTSTPQREKINDGPRPVSSGIRINKMQGNGPKTDVNTRVNGPGFKGSGPEYAAYQNDDHEHFTGDDVLYQENYAVDDVPSDELSEEGPLNDFPAGKRVHTHSYPYGRRPVLEKLLYTKDIIVKQGRLKGIVRKMHLNSGLRDVDQFLGLPYAEAPVGSKRFMPPGAPPPWNGVKVAAHLPPVCPQNIPDLNKTNMRLSKGRLDQLSRLLPYLKNESEDCLYLNVYVPRGDGEAAAHKFPVIVYIHGESYEWNSGNPYDGSVLASYGQVIVVTVNYRLGVLGFMRPGIGERTMSNFGLLDQIAALQWVKDNIESFGGDSAIVTIMGHGTGAACANFLMISPIAEGLFHRAILMSGSAMSDWASANHSVQISMQIAHGVNCPLVDANEEMLTCLRKRRYKDLLKIPTSSPQFSTSLGPIVDGWVIPNQPYKQMGTFTELFSRFAYLPLPYDLLFGVTEVESYHILNAQALEDGLSENERDDILRFYTQNRFEVRPDLARAATLKRYEDVYNNPSRATPHEHRDVVLDILSDGRVVGPLLQTGVFHAKVNPRSYMYVFGHNSGAGAYAHLPHSITGEELAFIFGAPLAPAGPFHNRYSLQEKLLSEAVMLYWTNFAKTGNPKAPWKDHFINLHALEWDRYDIDWPEFSARNQCYINIGIPPSIGYRYRSPYMTFWNKELPDDVNQIAAVQPPFIHFFPPSPTQVPRRGTSTEPNEVITGYLSKYPPKRAEGGQVRDPYQTIKYLLKEPTGPPGETVDSMYNAQPTFGATEDAGLTHGPDEDNEKEIVPAENAMHILIGVVILFVVFNFIVAITYVMKRKKKNSPFGRKLTILSYDGTTDDELKRSKNNDGDDSYVLDIVRKSNTYEAVKTSNSPINGFKITRQLSTSTVDPHTKVSDWISQDLGKCSPKSSKKSSPSFSLRRSFLRKPRKVSVAIDATPQARSNSILRQEPIEVTKLKAMDGSRNIIICQEVDVDAELLSPDTVDSGMCYRRGSSCSIPDSRNELKVDHKHSRSDPVEMYYSVHTNDEKVTSFIDADINVTSREEGMPKDPLTPEEQLQTIKRRNFPKVLPTEEGTLPGSVMNRKSLSSFNFPTIQIGKVPPAPPPRTISTSGRRSSIRRQSDNITTSPLMLAENCSDDEEEEPQIAKNTLIVGPLIPKSQESIYCTVNRNRKHRGGHPEQAPPQDNEAELRLIRPSGIKPPSTALSAGLQGRPHNEPEQPPRMEPKIIIRPSPPKAPSNKFHIPRVHGPHDTLSRIPQLRTGAPLATGDRDKSTPESSSSEATSSSTGTVKTELKQN